MIDEKEFEFLLRMRGFKEKGRKSIKDYAHMDSISRNSMLPFCVSRRPIAYYYNSRKERWFESPFVVSNSNFHWYEDYTPYHFAGFATKLFADNPRGLDDLSQLSPSIFSNIPANWDDVSYMSEKWKLGKLINGNQFPQWEEVVELAIDKVNSTIKKLCQGVRVTDLFVVDPIGWTIPVKLEYGYEMNERRIIDRDYRLAEYRCFGDDDNGKAPYPLETHSYIVLYIKEINDLMRTIADKRWNYGVNNSKNVIAYVLAHELFHAWQDFHVGLMHYSTCRKRHLYIDDKDEMETLAEFFALNYVGSVLKDKPLVKILYDFRKEEAREAREKGEEPKAYAAVTEFGDNLDNVRAFSMFIKKLADWEDSMIHECY